MITWNSVHNLNVKRRSLFGKSRLTPKDGILFDKPRYIPENGNHVLILLKNRKCQLEFETITGAATHASNILLYPKCSRRLMKLVIDQTHFRVFEFLLK